MRNEIQLQSLLRFPCVLLDPNPVLAACLVNLHVGCIVRELVGHTMHTQGRTHRGKRGTHRGIARLFDSHDGIAPCSASSIVRPVSGPAMRRWGILFEALFMRHETRRNVSERM